ncbi:hypothetical protein EV383_6255 [Pseudonocardia sediminis]|uniref:Uncharacterized protein n=1 Tax=Pseudonocardia sediminis TaxID=1397368 RepID=A0A4Q7U7I8_PSEST|nr:hypothetical protein [Pseudonocardia sediminis]RZT75514.1 hypothetical protein EV383_6255 [Pseudonocardia sediminis]
MTDQVGPDPLPVEAVNGLEQLADAARAALSLELTSGVAVGTPFGGDTVAALGELRAGLVRAGLDEVRADRAVTAWMFFPERSVALAVTTADAAQWREPGKSPGGLGAR